MLWSQQVSGSLRFSLFYEPLPSRLVVTILQAEGLQRRSQAHRPHPFVRLRLMWEEPENQEQKSSLMNEKVRALKLLWPGSKDADDY